VHWGHSFESEGAPAYWPWVQILREWIHALDPASVGAALGRGATDVALILPEVRDLVPDLPDSLPVDPAQVRFRLFDSVTTLLRRTAHAPSVLVLDDLQWADEPSMLLLELLAGQLADAPILVVGTYRDVELTPDHPLSRVLGGMLRRSHVQRLVLDRLSPDEVVQLVAETPGMPRVAETVLQRAEGNPLFVGEMLQLLQADGRDLSADASARTLVPPTVHDVIRRRLSRLSDACRRVLTVAAVIGPECDLRTLQAVSPQDDDETVDALDEAEALRIITPLPSTGPGLQLRFTHVLVRDSLYDSLPAGQRARLHLQVGAALERLPGPTTDARLSELAHHFVQAASISRPEAVLRHVRRAAERAIQVLAYEVAVRLYTLALQLLDVDGSDDLAARCDLLLQLGTVQAWMTDDAASRRSFLEAAELARELRQADEEPDRATSLLARAALGYAGAARQEYRSPDAGGVRLLEEALAACGDEDSPDRARLLARIEAAETRPGTGYSTSHPGTRAGQDAIAVARRVDDPPALMDALLSRYYGMAIDESRDGTVPLCDEIEQLASRLRNPMILMDARRWRLKYYLEAGDLAAADAATAAYADLMREIQHPSAAWRMAVVRMSRALLVGDFAASEQASAEAARLGPKQPRPGMPWHAPGELYLLRVEQGRLEEAERLVDELRRAYPAAPPLRCARAWILSERGALPEARAEHESLAARDYAELHTGGRWNYSAAFLARLCANLDDAPRAALLYHLLLPQARHTIISGVTFACYGAAAYHLGRLAATMRRPDLAAGHFEAAIRHHERLQARPWLARTRYQYAAALLAGRAEGTQAQAVEQARLALSAAADLGMPRLHEQAAALLASVRQPAPPPQAAPTEPPTTYPDSLTAREVDVLRLLASGASNAEIARRLVLSPGTVHWYTVKIYQKIGIGGRAEAAPYAARHGLIERPGD
jgi:DNA-binding NarL/FixJ family response regulator